MKKNIKLCDLKDVPAAGSLGLLALGAKGIILWRKKRKESGYKIEHSNFIKKKNEKKNEK